MSSGGRQRRRGAACTSAHSERSACPGPRAQVPAAATYPACAKCVPDCPCAQIRSTPAVDSEGSVYFGSYDYSVYKLDADGKMKWNFTTGSSVYGR